MRVKRPERMFLQEEVMLLARKDETGRAWSAACHRFALAGALLAELLLSGRIRIDEHRKRKLVEAADPRPLGDAPLDECLERVRTARRRASPSAWVTRFAKARRLKQRIARGLCERGILREERARLLLRFGRKAYHELDPEPARALIERLRAAILGEDTEVDPRTAILIAIADPTGLLRPVLGAKELNAGKKGIRSVASGEIVGDATAEAFQVRRWEWFSPPRWV